MKWFFSTFSEAVLTAFSKISHMVTFSAPKSSAAIELFGSFMKPAATLLVSGIIDERLDEVNAALSENGFKVRQSRNEEGWNCIILTR